VCNEGFSTFSSSRPPSHFAISCPSIVMTINKSDSLPLPATRDRRYYCDESEWGSGSARNRQTGRTVCSCSCTPRRCESHTRPVPSFPPFFTPTTFISALHGLRLRLRRYVLRQTAQKNYTIIIYGLWPIVTHTNASNPAPNEPSTYRATHTPITRSYNHTILKTTKDFRTTLRT
jgi:hypothetical protein